MLAVRWDATVPAVTLRVAALAVGLVLSAVGGAAQQADPSPASAARENRGSEAADDVGSPLRPSSSEAGAVTSFGADTVSPGIDASLERRFNEVKRELLEQREKSIDRWLAVVGLVLTFFAIVIAIAGLWAYRSFRSIEAEAKKSAAASRAHEEKARGLVKEITGHREESQRHLELIRGVTAEGLKIVPGRRRGRPRPCAATQMRRLLIGLLPVQSHSNGQVRTRRRSNFGVQLPSCRKGRTTISP